MYVCWQPVVYLYLKTTFPISMSEDNLFQLAVRTQPICLVTTCLKTTRPCLKTTSLISLLVYFLYISVCRQPLPYLCLMTTFPIPVSEDNLSRIYYVWRKSLKSVNLLPISFLRHPLVSLLECNSSHIYGRNQSGCEKAKNVGFLPLFLWGFLTIYIFVDLILRPSSQIWN